MKHINIAMEKMDNGTVVKDEENLSIIERIVQKTGNPKIAAVLALDLFLVGVDTVSEPISCAHTHTHWMTNEIWFLCPRDGGHGLIKLITAITCEPST